MRIGKLPLRHVTADTVVSRPRAWLSRMIRRELRRRIRHVAFQTFLVVIRRVMDHRLVRIVAPYAGDARVALGPALAVEQPIRRKPDCRRSSQIAQLHIDPCHVTGTAKVH